MVHFYSGNSSEDESNIIKNMKATDQRQSANTDNFLCKYLD